MDVRASVRVGIVALAMVCALAGCSGSDDSPVGPGQTGGSSTPGGTVTPTGGNCRTLATASTGTTTTTASAFTSTSTTNCSFNANTNQVVCAIQYSDSTGASSTTTQTSTYASRAALVDEVAVIPPLTHALSVATTGGSSQTMTFSYDGQGRLTGSTLPGATTTYTAWDAAGRPTAGTSVLATNTNTLAISYSSSAQTTQSTSNGQTTTCVLTYDANGNPTAQSCAAGNTVTTTVYTTTATTQVCK